MRFKVYGYALGAAAAFVTAAPASSVPGDACAIVSTVYVPTVTTVYATDIDITRTATVRSTKQVQHTATAVVTVTSTLMTESVSSLQPTTINTDGEGITSNSASGITSSLEPISTDVNTNHAEGSASSFFSGTTSSLEPISTGTDDGDGIFSFYVSGTSTVWLNGQTPDASKPVVYLTTSLTITPTLTHTMTVHSTTQSTIWVTETVQPSLPSSMASSFTGASSVGWNKTSTFSVSGSDTPTPYFPIPVNGSSAFATGISTSLESATAINSTFTASPSFLVNSSSAAPTMTSDAFPVSVHNHSTASATGTFTARPSVTLANSTTIISSAFPVNSSSTDPAMTSDASPVSMNMTVFITSTVTSPTSVPVINSTTVAVSSFRVNTSSVNPAMVTGTSTSLASQPVINATFTNVSTLPVNTSSVDPAMTTSTFSSLVSTSLINSTATSASATTASASPTACGEIGDFVLNFDDIPPLVVNNNTDPHDVQPAPVFNPYHQFDFSEGFTVVPPPTTLFVPESGKLLLEFIPNPNGTIGRGLGSSGGISDGDHGLTGCFDFNFYGAVFGCDSRGPDCDFTFSGYRLVGTDLVQVASHSHMIPACQTADQCELTPINVDDSFQNLDSVRINVTVAGVPKIWWMDDLKLGWFNNSCEMGLCRQNAHLH